MPLRVVSPTACTGTQYLQAVGHGEGGQGATARDEIVYVSSGEGATSEGEFFEALNYAGRDQLPVLFLVQNNGYAISVPQSSPDRLRDPHDREGLRGASVEVDGTRSPRCTRR